MKHISILVPETAMIEVVADPNYMFKAVNQFLEMSGKPALLMCSCESMYFVPTYFWRTPH